MRIVVVFPAPLGPSSPKTVPSSTARSTPLTARTLPNDFVSASVRMIASSMAAETIGRPGHRHPSRWDDEKGKKMQARNHYYEPGISWLAGPFLRAWKGLKT